MQYVNVSNSLNSGQVFLWKKINEIWYGINGQNILKIDESFDHNSCNEKERNFLRLDDDYEKIIKGISNDKIVKQSVNKYIGLRLLRQDPFQCCISFITSSNSNIQNIKLSLMKICRKFGKKIKTKGEFYSFPTPLELSKASTNELLSCGLGYRAKYVKKASQMIAQNQIDFELLKEKNYHDAKNELIQIPGIGNKVADCIMLFSLEKLDAFPIDTWMIKVLQNFYSEKFLIDGKNITTKKYEILHQQVVQHFGKYAGFSQQFLFKWMREQNHKKWL